VRVAQPHPPRQPTNGSALASELLSPGRVAG
jgi:hypothetical protein